MQVWKSVVEECNGDSKESKITVAEHNKVESLGDFCKMMEI